MTQLHRSQLPTRPVRRRYASLGTALALLLSFAAISAGSVPAAAAAAVSTPGGFTALAPARLLDTRSGLGLSAGRPAVVAPGAVVSLQVAGRGGVPATGVGSVVLNVTVTSPTRAGFVTVYAGGAARPATANVSFAAAQTIPDLVLTRVGTNGTVSLANISAGTLHLVADVSGYHRDGTVTAAGAFVSLPPVRLLDTPTGVGAPRAPVGPGASVSLTVTGPGGVPAGVSAVALNVTAAAPTGAGYLTVYGGAVRPFVSNLNFTAGGTISNLVVVSVGTGGRVVLYNGSGGTVALSADVQGYYRAGVPVAAGMFVALAPARLLDTRTSLGLALVANPKVAVVVAAARGILGTPYSYGGGTAAGPTLGIAQGSKTVGFDCSASVLYEYAKAGVTLSRMTTGQEKQGVAVPVTGTTGLSGAQAGDLLFWGTPGYTSHVALYIGSGKMIEARQTGTFVHLVAVWGTPTVIRRIFPLVAATVAIASGASVRLVVTGHGGVPASGVSAALLNVTVTAPSRAGFVTVYASGAPRPWASNLNFSPGQTIPNLVATPVGADGSVLLYNGSAGTVHLVADVSGYYRA